MSENTEKYVCRIGDLTIKDDEARKELSTLQEEVTNKSTIKEVNKDTDISLWVGSEEELENTSESTGKNVICFTDSNIIEKIEAVIETEVAKRVEENSLALQEKITQLQEKDVLLEEKDTQLEKSLATKQPGRQIMYWFEPNDNDIAGTLIDEKQLHHYYSYKPIVCIEATTYSNENNINLVNIPLIFTYDSSTGLAGWSGQGVMCVCTDKENDFYETYKVVVDISGTMTRDENYVYKLRLGVPEIWAGNNDIELPIHIKYLYIT